MINLNDIKFYYNKPTERILHHICNGLNAGDKALERYTSWRYPIKILGGWQSFKFEYHWFYKW